MYGCHPYKRHNPSFNFRVLHGFVRENSVLKYESFVLVLHLPPKFRTVEHACTWGVLTDCGGAPHQVCDTNLAAALLPNGSMVGVWRHCETVNLHTMPYSLLARGDTSPPAAGYVPSTSENFPFMAHAGAQLAPGVFWLSRFFFSFLFSKRRRSLWDLGLAGCQSHSAAKPSHRGARSPRSRPHEIRSVILSVGRSHNKQRSRGGGLPVPGAEDPFVWYAQGPAPDHAAVVHAMLHDEQITRCADAPVGCWCVRLFRLRRIVMSPSCSLPSACPQRVGRSNIVSTSPCVCKVRTVLGLV